jgi:hypothetical protein
MSKAQKEPKEPKPKSSAVPPALPTAVDPSAPRFLPVLALLFVGSGCAALIYEVVWFQLLQLTVGSSAVSMGVLLATYMGGMCMGVSLCRDFLTRGNTRCAFTQFSKPASASSGFWFCC